MSVRLLFAFLTVFFSTTLGLIGQEVEINNIVATDIVTSDKDVIELNFKDQLPNLPFILAWLDKNGKQYAIRLATSEDKLIVPIHNQPSWKDTIGLLGLSIDNVDVVIRKLNVRDHWRSFMTMHPMTPGSINFTQTYQWSTITFRKICLVLFVLITGVLFFKFRNIQISLLLGFLIAWSQYDIRSTKNRWDIMSQLSDQEYKIPIFKDLDVFLIEARKIIGDQPWTKEQLSGVINSYCTYQLADLSYKPQRSKIKNEADFIITTKPKSRKIVYSHGPYFLIAQNPNK